MSTSFRTAMGWGMPWFDFEAATTMDCETHLTADALDTAFADADRSLFEIPEHVADIAADAVPCNGFHTLNPLRDNVLVAREDVFTFGDPAELTTRVFDLGEEEDVHVIFFPDLHYAKQWQRTDDDLDLAHLYRWANGGERDTPTSTEMLVRYVGYGHGPFRNDLMTTEGEPVAWMTFGELRKRKDIVPRVPPAMRWYLTKLGVLDDRGVNMLRPVVARWFA